jgi:phosphatidate cytidylyltransferase
VYGGLFWVIAVLVAALVRLRPTGRPLAAVGITVFAPLYTSATLACLIAVRHGVNSARQPLAYACLALFPLALTWICDTAAYAAGRRFGGPKLTPAISPGKTWSGAVGGVVGALVCAPVLGVLGLNGLGWRFGVGQLVAAGLLVAIVAQVGDAAESLLKREAGVKDSSNLIPGHGGVLDRLDSLYFAVPVSAALFDWYGAI